MRVRVVDVGGDEVGNVALQALVPLDRTILAGAESHWEATIRNDSPRVLSRAKAILRVDDRPTEVPLPEIPPRQAVRVPLTARFPSQGIARHLPPAARGRAGRATTSSGRRSPSRTRS